MTVPIRDVTHRNVVDAVKDPASHENQAGQGGGDTQHICVEHDGKQGDELKIHVGGDVSDTVADHFPHGQFLVFHFQSPLFYKISGIVQAARCRSAVPPSVHVQ